MSLGSRTLPHLTEPPGPPLASTRVRARRPRSGHSAEQRRPRRFDPWLLGGLVVTAAGLAVMLVVAIQQTHLLSYGDSVSHILIPTRVFKGYDAGFYQLGVHWLPLAHVLQLPFAWIAPLYREGTGGVIVSVVTSLVTALYLYRLARLVGSSGASAFLATVMLAASPSFLYIGVVPMLPSTIMAAATANIYYLTRWAINPERTGLLVAAGLTLSLATLSHIDTWPLVPLEFLIVAVVVHRRWRSRVHTTASSALIVLVGSYGVASYLLMNLLIFGHPLAFLGNGVERGKGAEGVLRPLHGLAAMVAHPQAVWENAGPALAIVGLLGTVLHVWHRRSEPRFLVPLLLFYPVIWYALQAASPLGSYILPSDNLNTFVHVRYAVTVLPALAYFGAVGFRWRPIRALAAIAVLAGTWSMVEQDQVATWVDARSEMGDVIDDALRPVARAFGENMGEGLVFMPVVEQYNDRFVLLTGRPPSRFLDANASDWRPLRTRPSLARVLGAAYILKVGYSDPAGLNRALSATGARLCLNRPPSGTIPPVQIYTLTGTCPVGGPPEPPNQAPAAGKRPADGPTPGRNRDDTSSGDAN